MTAFARSSLATPHRRFARGAACAREHRVGEVRRGHVLSSTAVYVPRAYGARPGGFGKSDRLPAGLGEVRDTNHELTERRVRAGPSLTER